MEDVDFIESFDFNESIMENINQVSEFKSLEKAADTLESMGFGIFDSVEGLRKTLGEQ